MQEKLEKYLTHPVFSAMMLTGGTVLVVVEAVGEVVVLFCCWEVEGEQFGLSVTPMGFVFSPKRFPVVLLAAPDAPTLPLPTFDTG